MKTLHYAALLLLGALWGASFLFIGVAVKEFGPFNLMFLRVSGASSILLLFAALLHGQVSKALKLRKNWRKYLILGLLNSALPFSLIAFSELYITVSLAAILNSTTPLFTAIIAVIWKSETFGRRKAIGVLLGMLGVGVLVGWGPIEYGPRFILAVLASLLAAFFYGAGTVYASKNLNGLAASYAAVVQLFSAALILAPAAVLTIPARVPSTLAVAALLALMLLSTSLAYLIYFFLLDHVGPTRTASVTFLIPIFGTFGGATFLGEPITTGMFMGVAIILTSVGMVTGTNPRKAKVLASQ